MFATLLGYDSRDKMEKRQGILRAMQALPDQVAGMLGQVRRSRKLIHVRGRERKVGREEREEDRGERRREGEREREGGREI